MIGVGYAEGEPEIKKKKASDYMTDGGLYLPVMTYRQCSIS